MSRVSPSRGARIVDAVQYAVGLTLLLAVLVLPFSLLRWGGLWGVKFGLFLLGFLSLGYATVLAWPKSPEDLEGDDIDREETRLQGLLRRVPPAAWYPLSVRDRYPNWVRLYLASLTMLAVSYALEAFFGV